MSWLQSHHLHLPLFVLDLDRSKAATASLSTIKVAGFRANRQLRWGEEAKGDECRKSATKTARQAALVAGMVLYFIASGIACSRLECGGESMPCARVFESVLSLSIRESGAVFTTLYLVVLELSQPRALLSPSCEPGEVLGCTVSLVSCPFAAAPLRSSRSACCSAAKRSRSAWSSARCSSASRRSLGLGRKPSRGSSFLLWRLLV